MAPIDFAPVLHVVGFLAAIAVYAMLLVMVWRVGLTEATRLPLAAGILGLIWNLGSLGMFGLPELGFDKPPEVFHALAYTALGFLPAAVVHSILIRRKDQRSARWLITAAYLLSGIAGLGHFLNLATRGFAPSPAAVHLLTPVYGFLIVPLAFLTRREPTERRALWMVALALFAVTGTTLARHTTDSMLMDLVGHHASMLLAFVILYQEYRFALADLFLKRALTLIALISIAMGSYVLLVPWAMRDEPSGMGDPRVVGLVLALWIATALIYPSLRQAISRLVDRLILGRDSFGQLKSEISEIIESGETSSSLLNQVSSRLARALGAGTLQWTSLEEEALSAGALLGWSGGVGEVEPAIEEILTGDFPPSFLDETVRLLSRGTGAVALVPTAESPRYLLAATRLHNGRLLTAEDATFLEWVALRLARRIDRLRTIHERYEHELREKEMKKLATEAELRALRAQINPHFLFNALTTIGHLIQTAPGRAMDTLMNLTELLRRVLRSNEEMTTLGEEIELVTAYLDIERARFEERLETEIHVPEAARSVRVPSLILQPLVENSVKHGIAPTRSGGRVTVEARLESKEDESGEPVLMLSVRDSGEGADEHTISSGRRRGVGLRNVEERLRYYYGGQASIAVSSQAGSGTSVEVRLPVSVNATVSK
jgi:two-component sensor histidine kinase